MTLRQMPAQPQPIDWPGIRANAMAVGVREAARQAGRDLPPDEQNRFVERVLKRSTREGWIARKVEVQAAAQLTRIPGKAGAPSKPLSANVRTSADGMANALAETGKQTKLHLVKATSAAAQAFAGRTGEGVIKSAKALREITSTAATLHGWEEKRDASVQINLGIQINGLE